MTYMTAAMRLFSFAQNANIGHYAGHVLTETTMIILVFLMSIANLYLAYRNYVIGRARKLPLERMRQLSDEASENKVTMLEVDRALSQLGEMIDRLGVFFEDGPDDQVSTDLKNLGRYLRAERNWTSNPMDLTRVREELAEIGGRYGMPLEGSDYSVRRTIRLVERILEEGMKNLRFRES